MASPFLGPLNLFGTDEASFPLPSLIAEIKYSILYSSKDEENKGQQERAWFEEN
jgi:hypothetical protein